MLLVLCVQPSDMTMLLLLFFFFLQAEDGIRDLTVTGFQPCALPISPRARGAVGGNHENGLLVAAGAAPHAAEPADGAARQGRACRAHQLGDAALRLLGGVELHPNGAVAVGFGHSSPSKEKWTRSRNAFTRPCTSGRVMCSSRWTPKASTASDPRAEP